LVRSQFNTYPDFSDSLRETVRKAPIGPKGSLHEPTKRGEKSFFATPHPSTQNAVGVLLRPLFRQFV
jgi:hypothetical protein